MIDTTQITRPAPAALVEAVQAAQLDPSAPPAFHVEPDTCMGPLCAGAPSIPECSFPDAGQYFCSHECYNDLLAAEAQPAFHVEPDELPYREAAAAYAGISFSPEKRAQQEQVAYAEHLNGLYARLLSLASTPEAHALLVEEMQRYRSGYNTRYRAFLRAKSRTLSPMITGPSRFPTDRNRKRMDTETRRWDELREWMERAQSAIRRKLVPEEARAISSDDPDAPEKLAAKLRRLEEAQETMKAANKIIRRHKGGESAVPDLMELGLSEARSRELLQPDFAGRIGFADYALQNNRAEIQRVRQRIQVLNARRADADREWNLSVAGVGSVQIVDNVAENRLQLFFPVKPSEELRERLQRRGFRWARSVGAWQRHRSTGARWAAEEVLGVSLADCPAVAA